VTCGEGRCLVDHPGVGVLRVFVEVDSAGADRVIGDAQVDGLGGIQRADGDRRLVNHTHKSIVGCSE
jgi:hypothetical protein